MGGFLVIELAVVFKELDDDDRTFMLNLYKNYYGLARKTVYNITHEFNDIEDLINDSFIKLIEKISLLRTLDQYKITTYVVYTVRSVTINYIKHKKVENKYMYYSDDVEIIKELYNKEDDIEIRLIYQEEMEMLKGAISLLPEKEKDLLYFKYILDLKDIEIADILCISPNSVREYLTRARRDAKKLMEKEMHKHAK